MSTTRKQLKDFFDFVRKTLKKNEDKKRKLSTEKYFKDVIPFYGLRSPLITKVFIDKIKPKLEQKFQNIPSKCSAGLTLIKSGKEWEVKQIGIKILNDIVKKIVKFSDDLQNNDNDENKDEESGENDNNDNNELVVLDLNSPESDDEEEENEDEENEEENEDEEDEDFKSFKESFLYLVLLEIEKLLETSLFDWGNIDIISSKVMKEFIVLKPKLIPKLLLNRWSKNCKYLWKQRCSCVSFVNIARFGDHNETILKITDNTIKNSERFCQLGTGWVLRELGLANIKQLEKFIVDHYDQFSREGLRYAIEKMNSTMRTKYLYFKKNNKTKKSTKSTKSPKSSSKSPSKSSSKSPSKSLQKKKTNPLQISPKRRITRSVSSKLKK